MKKKTHGVMHWDRNRENEKKITMEANLKESNQVILVTKNSAQTKSICMLILAFLLVQWFVCCFFFQFSIYLNFRSIFSSPPCSGSLCVHWMHTHTYFDMVCQIFAMLCNCIANTFKGKQKKGRESSISLNISQNIMSNKVKSLFEQKGG